VTYPLTEDEWEDLTLDVDAFLDRADTHRDMNQETNR
jgi:hypothetical protein